MFTAPAFKFRFSPTTNPLDIPAWEDITPFVLSFDCKYGRQFELNRVEAGVANFILDNADRRFDPFNIDSPYYPNLLPMRKFQIYAPNVVPQDGGTQTVTSSAAGTGTVGYVVTGTPGTYHDGLFTASRVQSPASKLNATQGWVAARLKMGFASSSGVLTGTTPAVFRWANDANNLLVGGMGKTGSQTYFFTNRKSGGVGGEADSLGVTHAAGDYVTVVFKWTATSTYVSVNGAPFVVASDTHIPTMSASLFDIGTDQTGPTFINSTVCWLATGTGTMTNADAAGIAALPNSLTIWSAANFNPIGDATMMLWPESSAVSEVWPAVSPTYRIPSDAFVFTGYVEQWPTMWEGPSWAETDCTAVDAFEVLSLANLISSSASLTTAQGSNKDITFTANVLGSGGNLISVTYESTGTLGVTMDDLNVHVTINAGVTTANDIITAVNGDEEGTGLFVTADLAPGSSGVGTVSAMAETFFSGGTFVEELTGARVGHVLDNINWPVGDRALDPGQATVVAAVFRAADDESAKSHINDIENSELGYVFISGDGVIHYHDRAHRDTATLSTVSQGTFGDRLAELEYSGLTASYDKTYIFNKVVVSQNDSSAGQTVTDQVSIDEFMERIYTLATQLTSASDALALANYILLRYAQPKLRFASMVIEPFNSVGLWLQGFTRTIGDLVTVVRRPPSHTAPTTYGIGSKTFVESVGWKLQQGLIDAEFDYEMSPSSVFFVDPGTGLGFPLTLDDATLGRLQVPDILT